MECFLQKSNENTLMRILQEDSIVKLGEDSFMNSKENPFISHTQYIHTYNTHISNIYVMCVFIQIFSLSSMCNMVYTLKMKT